jgi:hypothetical protein
MIQRDRGSQASPSDFCQLLQLPVHQRTKWTLLVGHYRS